MNKIKAQKNLNIQKCEKILKELNENNKNDFYEIENIIRKDNTEEIFILTYLKLIEKFNGKNLENEFDRYMHILSKESINKNFPQFNDKKVSSSDLFFNIYNKILNYRKNDDSYKKVQFYKELVYINPKYDNIRGFTDYEKNKELAIYFLVIRIKVGIIKHIKKIEDFFINNDDPLIKMQKLIKNDAEIFKKVERYEIYNTGEEPSDEEKEKYKIMKKSNNNYNDDDFIEQCNENIILISKIYSQDFLIYFENLKTFLSKIKINFDKRFQNIKNLTNEDFGLLIDFCFFLVHYDFKSKSLNFYIKKWNNTFYQSREFIKTFLERISFKNKYYLENDDLIMEEYDDILKQVNIKRIKDIDKYSINCIVSDLINNEILNEFPDIDTSNYIKSESIINYYTIENYLKFDSTKEIYINKIWNIFKDYIITIFTSKTIKSAFLKICEELKIVDYYDFLNKNELEIILNRTRFFQFSTDIIGLTEPLFFLNLLFYRGMIESYPESWSKLLNLSLYIVIQEQEILGHLNVRIQNYFSQNEISSPITESKDKFEIITINDFIEKTLYGKRINQMNFNEILYILDVENYNLDLDVFKNNFISTKKDKYTPSKFLSDLLTSLNITIPGEINIFKSLNINTHLIGKFSSNNDLFLNRGSHTDYFHPKKESNSLQDVLDYYNKNYAKLIENDKSKK